MDNLVLEVLNALEVETNYKGSYSYADSYLDIDRISNGYEITISKMYDHPATINLRTLKGLSLLFGTDEIDVDDFANSGCESCDWNSNYGHTIQVLSPTLRVDELEELSGKGNLLK